MIVLAFDTTSRRGGLALLHNGHVMEARAVSAPDGFAAKLYPEIRDLLEQNEVSLAEVDCYASASGPGSFTGIRIGLTAVKSLAEVNRKKVVGVSNLRAMAELGEGGFRAPLMDARRGEVYAAVYDAQGLAVVDEMVTRWPAFVELVGRREVTFLSCDAGLFTEKGAAPLGAARRSSSGSARHMILKAPLAVGVGRIATRLMVSGEVLDPLELNANYVRRPDAELNWRPPL